MTEGLTMANDLVFTDARDYKTLLRDGDVGNVAVRKQFIPELIEKTSDDDDDRNVRFIISTGAVDRDKDTINPNGFQLGNFEKNPVVLFAHDARRPPIGRASDIKVQGRPKKLKATVEFMDTDIDTSGFSDMIFRMVKNGFLNATSVGFMPIEAEFTDDEDRFLGIDFKSVELMEFSVVPVPSNPEALIDARKSGINTAPLESWYEEALDSWAEYKGMLLVPKKQVEGLYKSLHGSGYKRNRKAKLTDEEQAALLARNIAAVKAQTAEASASEDEPDGIPPFHPVTGTDDFDATFEMARKDTRATFPYQDGGAGNEAGAAAAGHIHTYDDTNHGVTSVNDGHSHTYLFGTDLTDPGGSDNHQHKLNGFMGQEPHAQPAGVDGGPILAEPDDENKVVKLELEIDNEAEAEKIASVLNQKLEGLLEALSQQRVDESGVKTLSLNFDDNDNLAQIDVTFFEEDEDLEDEDLEDEDEAEDEEEIQASAESVEKDETDEDIDTDDEDADEDDFLLELVEDESSEADVEEEVDADEEEDAEPEIDLEMVSQLVAEAVPAAVKEVIREEIKRLTGRVD